MQNILTIELFDFVYDYRVHSLFAKTIFKTVYFCIDHESHYLIHHPINISCINYFKKHRKHFI